MLSALAGAVIAFFVRIEGRLWDRGFPVVDALALGCWASVGSQKALAVGLGWLPSVLLGTITAVGGGMVGDVVLRRIPGIFGGNTLYATSALLASGVMVALYRLGVPSVGLVVSTVVGAGLTLVARWRGWQLPEPYVWQPSRALVRHPPRHPGAQSGEEHEPEAGAPG
ncbi:MAG TPA: TRIC cation channel family protein [Jatrophihabitans sp.]|nr:TRIC cation channel family protein [Jatrophihabitans sp.]